MLRLFVRDHLPFVAVLVIVVLLIVYGVHVGRVEPPKSNDNVVFVTVSNVTVENSPGLVSPGNVTRHLVDVYRNVTHG